MTDHDLDPTNLQEFMSLVNKTGDSSSVGMFKQIPLRLSIWEFSRLEALCKHMQQPRNKVLNFLIAIALDQVYENLENGDIEIKRSVYSHLSHHEGDGAGDLSND